jgi:hypothetical protein
VGTSGNPTIKRTREIEENTKKKWILKNKFGGCDLH